MTTSLGTDRRFARVQKAGPRAALHPRFRFNIHHKVLLTGHFANVVDHRIAIIVSEENGRIAK